MAGLITDYLSYGSGAPSGAPDVVAGEFGLYQDTATGDLYVWNLDTTTWDAVGGGGGGGGGAAPVNATMWASEMLAFDASNTPISSPGANDASQEFCSAVSQGGTAHDGDYFTLPFTIAAGTYTVYVLGIRSTNRGKLDWYLDAAGSPFEAGQDWYSVTADYNYIQTMSITIGSDGNHVLKGKINGKTGSAYYWALTKIWIR